MWDEKRRQHSVFLGAHDCEVGYTFPAPLSARHDCERDGDCEGLDFGIGRLASTPRGEQSYQRPPILWQASFPPYTALAVEGARVPVVLMAKAVYQAWRQWQKAWTPEQWLLRQSHLSKDEGEALWRTWVEQGLLRPAARIAKPSSSRPRTLTAWLQVTDACNLGCPYCYITHQPRHMTPEVAQQVIRHLVARAVGAGYQRLTLKYAGGEPTLRWAVVRKMHTLAAELAEAQHLHLTGVLLTNGTTLTPALAQEIRDLGLQITISLDGLDTFHDVQRPSRHGRGSFEHVRRGLATALRAGLQPHLNITITRHNLAGLTKVVAFALSLGLSFHLSFYRQHHPGPPDALMPSIEALAQALEAVFDLLEDHQPLPFSPLDLLDQVDLHAPHDKACGAGLNYLAVDVTGRASACHMLLDQAEASLFDLKVLERLPHIHHLRNLPVDQRGECSRCPWRFWCAGGCPLHTFRLTGRWDLRSPYCRVYKTFIPRILKLEAQRLWHRLTAHALTNSETAVMVDYRH